MLEFSNRVLLCFLPPRNNTKLLWFSHSYIIACHNTRRGSGLLLILGTDVDHRAGSCALWNFIISVIGEGLLSWACNEALSLALRSRLRTSHCGFDLGLTEAKSCRRGDGSRLDGCGGVEARHQQTVEWHTGRDGHWGEKSIALLWFALNSNFPLIL